MTETCPVHPSVTLVEDASYDVPRKYCPRCESGDQGNSKRPTAPSGTDPLDFEGQRDAESASWKRADPKAALIERRAWNTWLVTLPDSEDAHLVTLQRDHGAVVGEYVLAESRDQCPARKYNDSEEPCAHQCTVRKAAFGGIEAVYGDVVAIFAADDVGTPGLTTASRVRWPTAAAGVMNDDLRFDWINWRIPGHATGGAVSERLRKV